MATFIRHTSCEKCGSRDNKAEYSDGSSWCFGCRAFTPGSFLEKISESRPDKSDNAHRVIPSDSNTHYSPDAVSWFTKYGMALDKLIKHGVKYSPSRNQIIFTWANTPLWQARNLDKEYTNKEGVVKKLPKYFTSGDHTNILPVYTENILGFWEETLVITEDALSALKIASGRALHGLPVDAMPLLGTHLPTSKLMALRAHKSIIVWLDHDKYKDAISIAKRLALTGVNATTVYTENDPKDYTYEEIRKYLQ